ncbi:MAG: F0F1 ATP synthase subunit B [Chloroflexi bacterium]|nr:F0F1 ATP synthase subunit B [Chloroflexota bacterium]
MGELGFHWQSLLVYLVNFTILLVFLYLLAYKPILRVLDQRSLRIKDSLEQAERVQKEAAERQAAFELQLTEARRANQAQFEEAQKRIAQYEREQKERADKLVGEELTKARSEIQRERDLAIDEVRAHFGELAITAAERIVRRSLDAPAHREVIDQVLQEGGAMGGRRS